MSTWICSLEGNRGRSIAVYDNKCVITTDVTLGSLITNNALDGQKTVFYADVVGIQFKESGLTIGYLQLETGSVQMNNNGSNMFSENTYTYEENAGSVSNALMRRVHNYIVDRIEGYKYGFVPNDESLVLLMEDLGRKNLSRNREVEKRVEEIKQLQAQEEEQKRLEIERQKKEEWEKKAQALKQNLESSENAGGIHVFLQETEKCANIKEIKKLWEATPFAEDPEWAELKEKIRRAELVERRYGQSPRDTQQFREELISLILT